MKQNHQNNPQWFIGPGPMNAVKNSMFTAAQVQQNEIRKRQILHCLELNGEEAEHYAKACGLPSAEELRREDRMRNTIGQGW